ncbi:hypothetical protein G6N76_03370 [Rhizobium daejeonense]|uniref:Uncharacterized protein n=1 Tax=Rhizobium daejeonense TaxID=240521 RepID=A0A6M1RXK9_9HYPH|nr:hypothetical protein [Rhizobium daejeonense]NGO62701.1 hypothetical protein [Rhizobium daejeonense]
MELDEAEEILALAASAHSGVKVEFLTKPEHIEVFAFIRPISKRSLKLCVELYTVLYKDGLPVQSCSQRCATPLDALKQLSSIALPYSDSVGVVAPHFYKKLENMFVASGYDTCEAAFARVREEVQ